MDLKNFNFAPFHTINHEWALLTSGTRESYNTMTVSWGGMGAIWNKPAVTVYVRPNRYTYRFMEKNEYFTVSFYGKEHQKDLGILGSKSGRDGDKVALTSLTPVFSGRTATFREANVTLVCQKIYCQDLDISRFPPEAVAGFYGNDPVHRMYIGEVIDIVDRRSSQPPAKSL